MHVLLKIIFKDKIYQSIFCYRKKIFNHLSLCIEIQGRYKFENCPGNLKTEK